MNTKKALSILWLAVFFAALPQARAQEWRWANYWTGNDGYGTDYYNFVQQTAIDDDGNVYVLGSFGGNAVLHATDGDRRFSDIPSVVATNKQGWGIMKFDSLGNYVWSRIIKSWNNDNFPLWMEMRGSEISVVGTYNVTHAGVNDWFYHLDSLTDRPWQHSTLFATFDLDGNLIEEHYLHTLDRLITAGGRPSQHLKQAKFHRDREGNTYIFATTDYAGVEGDPFSLVVDGREYDMYFPGSIDPTLATDDCFRNVFMYKLSPDWELLWHKRLVDHTDGVAAPGSYFVGYDTVNPAFLPYTNGLTFDDDDNMYLVGYIQLGLWGEYGGECNSYPAHIYWDSTHYATVLDISSSEKMPFIIKYNTDGEVVWCNQLYKHLDLSEEYATGIWTGCAIDGRYVYVDGDAGDINNSWVAFDSLGEHRLGRSNPLQTGRAFFASYNKQTGEYVTHGIVPAERISQGCGHVTRFTVKNNQVYSQSIGTHSAAGTYGVFQKDIFLNRWAIDGTYLDCDTITDEQHVGRRLGGVVIDGNGHISVDFRNKSPVAFSSGIHLDCSTTQSNAIFALKYDSRTMEPYPVPDNLGIAENQRNENTLTIYPNPASDVLALKLSGNERITKVEIYDLSGNLVGKHKGNSINVKNLPAGIYIVAVCAGKEKCAAKFEKL